MDHMINLCYIDIDRQNIEPQKGTRTRPRPVRS